MISGRGAIFSEILGFQDPAGGEPEEEIGIRDHLGQRPDLGPLGIDAAFQGP